jgi:hypothetical protein
MKIKFKNILAFITTFIFLISPVFKGGVRYTLLGITVAMSILCIILIKKSYVGIVFFFLALQNALLMTVPKGLIQIITYADEVFEIVLIVYLLYVMLKKRISLSNIEQWMIVFYGLYLLMCFLSSVFNDYASITVIILDAFVCIKFFLFYRGGLELSRNGVTDTKTFYEHTNFVCKILAVSLFLYSIHDLFFAPFFVKYDFRFFTYSLQLFFYHPTYLAAFCILIISVLILNMQYNKNNIYYILLLFIVTLLTFRAKAIAAIAIIFLIYLVFVKYNIPFKGLVISGAVAVAIYFSLNQVELYYTEQAGRYAPIRLKMMRDGITIANDHFPLGAGFGTFGTTVAYENGSPFYYNLGYMGGYYKEQPVGDVFWPGVFSESGWIGLLFFAIVIILMLSVSLQKMKENRFAGWCMLSIMTYALCSSTSETGFFHPAVAIMFVVFGIAAGCSNSVSGDTRKTLPKSKFKIRF